MREEPKNRRRLPNALWALAGALAALVIVVMGFGGFKNFSLAAKYAAVMRVIRTQFVGESDPDEVTDAALASAIASLDDQWSYYMNTEGYEQYQDYSANVYQGIGVTVTQDSQTGGFRIVTTTRDGPADRAGLIAGDIILAVDGISVTGGTTDDLRALIQADWGKQALVTVQGADGQSREVSVACETVYSNPVSYRMLPEDVGYIAISNFRQGAGEQSVAAVKALQEQGAKGLVFDVRDNPGGQVTEMVTILDYLLPEGDLFIRADKRGREAVETSDAACVELPMAVVVNGESYSAAEFFAAALRDYDWASIAGEHTTGKARSQVTFSLWDGSAVHLSKYTYLTPSRTDLYAAGGLTPDAEVSLTEEQMTQHLTGWLEPEDDPQVQAAVGLLHA